MFLKKTELIYFSVEILFFFRYNSVYKSIFDEIVRYFEDKVSFRLRYFINVICLPVYTRASYMI